MEYWMQIVGMGRGDYKIQIRSASQLNYLAVPYSNVIKYAIGVPKVRFESGCETR